MDLIDSPNDVDNPNRRHTDTAEAGAPARAMRFPHHTLSADVPFFTLDVISCRNMLGTFQPQVPEPVIELFHFALKPTGYLFLGGGAANMEHAGLLERVSARWHLYWRCRVGCGGVRTWKLSSLVYDGMRKSVRSTCEQEAHTPWP